MASSVPADQTESGAAPAPMEGHGAYNRSSAVQAAGLSPALPLFAGAADIVPLAPPPEPIVIADYGCSEGRNSLAPMRAAIAALRARAGAARAISVMHTDLPENDFAALFAALAGPDSYMHGDEAVFPAAIGRSFYAQILPANSVTLGWSSWAVQWLSRVPGPIPGHVQVACSGDEAARTRYARQAAEDWRTFLTHRSRELRSGARLVVLTMALDANGSFGYGPLLAALYAALEEAVAENFIRREELARMAIPTVGRSRADLLAPFAASGTFSALSVEQLEIFDGEDRFWNSYERNHDARAFAAGWAAFTRASVLPTLAAALGGGRNDPRGAEFPARIERGIAHRLAAAPERQLIPLARMVLAKRV